MRGPMLALPVLFVLAQIAQAQDAVPTIVIEGLTSEPQATDPEVAQAADSEPVAPWLVPLRPMVETATPGPLFRMQGQHARAEFRLFLPPGGLDGTLTLAQRSSIDVLPEGSQLVVRLNGEEIGQFTPRQFGALGAITMPLGPSARAGDNLVSIEAQHRHRIYCGADAEFDLWTEFDLTQSGLALPGEAMGTDAASFVAALTAQAATGRPIEIRAPEPPDAPVLSALAQALGRPLPDEALPIALRKPWSGGDGPAYARVTLLPSDTDRATIRRGGDGALVLVLEHRAGEAARAALVDEVLAEAEILPAPSLPMVSPGRVVTVATLGAPDIITNDRYFERNVDFRLPDEWLLLASQKARMGLDYGFAGGLPEGAVLLVKVNGTTVRMLPLDRDAAPVKPRLEMRFPARLLHPGPNRLSFEAIIPGNPPDEPCPSTQGNLLQVLGSTELFVPPSPRMTMADMARDLAWVTPAGVQPATPEGLARTLPFMSAFHDASDGRPVQLTVTGLHDLDRVPMAEAGLTPRLLARTLLPSAVSRLVDDRPAAETDTPANALTPLGAAPGESTLPALVESNWFDRARAFMLATLEPALHGVRRLVRPGDGDLVEWLASRKGEAMIIAPGPGELWVVLGPEASPARVASALAVAQHSPEGPRGQVAVLGSDGRWSSWSQPGILPRLEEPISLSNVRSVVGNVASARPPMLLGGMLGLAWISAAIAIAFVLRTRGRGDR
ncbi:cellulose biosynthesis cyclic di-GMP-binding regulatory protein BcsB [Rhodobacter sp. NSM]|uniref:cellulose biosynthesis cyclic di-GMP-binding regulatory protein BcsB n=1 Tax=Rhodobacter sp. NSM TaxID=3457501 RepID=UPI003FD397CF